MSAKILVIGEIAKDSMLYGENLADYHFFSACESKEAIQVLNGHEKFDLIMLDLTTPDMDGFSLLEAIKANERYNQTPVIILTHSDKPEDEIRGLELGAVDYIRKPVYPDALRVKLGIHMELVRVRALIDEKHYKQGLTFDVIFKQAPIGIAISYSSGAESDETIISINSVFQQIVGRTREEINELGWINITHPDDLQKDLDNFNKLKSGKIKSYSIEKRYVRPDGSIVWVNMVVASLTLPDFLRNYHICLVQDITEQKKLEEELLESERSKSVFLSSLPGMAYRCSNDDEWTMQFVSAGCYDLTGYTADELLYNRKLSFNDIIAPEYRDILRKEWDRILPERKTFRHEYEIETKSGERKWVLEMGQGVYDENGEVIALEGIIVDISDRKKFENYLRYNNEHDPWTGLYNRRYLENMLISEAASSCEEKRALVGINLSSIHRLSLTYGFHYSQEIIKRVAEALTGFCTDTCQLFNTYENRFVFYIKGYKTRDDLSEFCERIIKTIDSVYGMEKVGSGIGIVEIDETNKFNVEQLMRNLLNASERAIQMYKSSIIYCFFDSEMEAQLLREEYIKHELMHAISDRKDGGLFLQFQPIYNLKNRSICGFEALARLKSKRLGLVSPAEFIPIAEKTRLIIPIGHKIFVQAFKFLKKLIRCGYKDMTISINVSVMQLLNENFSRDLLGIISDMNINPGNIMIELTESLFVENYQEANRILGELKNAGIRVAIDDFGTGYSSLARERELNISCLKIDKSFVDKLLILKDESITGDIISMAHKLGHSVVAEGVEHEEQKIYLEKYNCDNIQGFLISRPLNEDVAIELLKY